MEKRVERLVDLVKSEARQTDRQRAALKLEQQREREREREIDRERVIAVSVSLAEPLPRRQASENGAELLSQTHSTCKPRNHTLDDLIRHHSVGLSPNHLGILGKKRQS